MPKLTATRVKAIDKPGRHADGGGLYLVVKPSGRKNWVYLYSLRKRRREMGLGSWPDVGLADARRFADEARTKVRGGIDPLDEQAPLASVGPTFGEAVEAYMAAMGPSLSNAKHRAQWESTLATYAARLTGKPIDAIEAPDVLACLTPIWQSKPETASRVRGRIERVLDYAKVQGWRDGENPARWRGHLSLTLPARTKLSRGHHAAMPWQDIPPFMQRLGDVPGAVARCIEFVVLTAARSGEARLMTWEEVDLAESLWTVPPERIKARRPHRVPLAPAAVEILEKQSTFRPYPFPGRQPARPLSDMALTMMLRRMTDAEYTVHGFRSAFRDWAADEAEAPRELAEAALAHVVGDATERAYRRGDALDRRRKLMEQWAEFVSSA